jgi:hypothetical protein
MRRRSWRELSDIACGPAVVYEIAQGRMYGSRHFLQEVGTGPDVPVRLGQQTVEIGRHLFFVAGRITDTQPRPQPAPERG